MRDTLRTLMLAGVGAVELSDEKARALLDRLVRRGELAAEEARTLSAECAECAAERRARETRGLRSAIYEALARQDVATQSSVRELANRVAALERALQALPPGRGHGAWSNAGTGESLDE